MRCLLLAALTLSACVDFDELDRCYGGTCAPRAGSTADASADASAEVDAGVRAGPGIKPDEKNTGVPPGIALTVVDGDVTIREDDAVVDAQDIRGQLTVIARRVTVRRSIVRGRAGSEGAVVNLSEATDALLEDSEIADGSAWILDGVWGRSFTARRVHLHVGGSGLVLQGTVAIEHSYVRGMSYAPRESSCIHVPAATQVRLTGNQVVATANENAALQVTQGVGLIERLLVDANWTSGGQCTFNLTHSAKSGFEATVQSNRFMGNTAFNCPILKSTQTTLLGGGNVWDDTGDPVTILSRD